MSWAREGEDQPLTGQQLKTAKTAAGSYSMAVEDSLGIADPGATVGQHLRQSWLQVQYFSHAMPYKWTVIACGVLATEFSRCTARCATSGLREV